ncbi:MAG: Rieske 2Fe-2S domain-containing protein [Myxococcota bacterium]
MSTTGRYSVVHVRRAWYVLCESSELRARPLKRALFDMPLAVFRGAGGEPVALVDRCAHRNVPISAGRVVHGEIECPYHGWRFDREGVCRNVPALVDDKGSSKARRVARYPTVERQGLVWAWGDPESDPAGVEPYVVPHLADSRYGTVRYNATFESTLHATAENILDVPHTAFLHRGLFRGAGKRNVITANLRRDAASVEADYVGEPRPSGLIGKLLAPQGGTVRHVDRFMLPSIAQVEYALGDSSHVLITNLLTPVSDFVTTMFAIVSYRLPIGGKLVGRILEPLAKRVVQQDAEVLAEQTRNVKAFGGERFVSTDVDLLGAHILRLLKHAERGETQEAGELGSVRLEV